MASRAGQLLYLVDHHFEAMEADFQRYYGLDLRACLWGETPMGVRRLCALIDHLPLDSALARDQARDTLGSGWNMDTELLAKVAELVDTTNRILVKVNSKPGTPEPRPIFIPRPYTPAKPKTNPAGAMKAWAARMGVPVKRVRRKKDKTA